LTAPGKTVRLDSISPLEISTISRFCEYGREFFGPEPGGATNE